MRPPLLNVQVTMVVALLAMLPGCSQDDATGTTTSASFSIKPPIATASHDYEINPRLLRRFQPLPTTLGADASEAETSLGHRLFYDPVLSKAGDISCNSCHDLAKFGVDGTPTALGHNGQHGTRNAPTVYNAAGHFAQFWDGRAADVEEQAKGPILNPLEMAMPNGDAVVAILKATPGYQEQFHSAFPGESAPLTFDNVGRALGAFERKLVTPGRWDDYLRGNKAALTVAEKDGLKTFLDAGCMVCHTGAYVGGSMYERVGVVEPWPNQSDLGRGGITKLASDNMMFKVPSLRNVEKTAPYFHDGSVATLDEAVRVMGRHQLGLELAPAEVDSIVTWLKSLTGELPRAYLTKDSAVDARVSCGVAPLPDCPLQAWMKANATPAISHRDHLALERAFHRIGSFAPAGYAGWAEIAARGEAAAAREDFEACRAACKQCHDQNRPRYTRERRTERLPPVP